MNELTGQPLLDAASLSACRCSETSSLPMFQMDIVDGDGVHDEREVFKLELTVLTRCRQLDVE
jgi:hypothetical protein